MTDSTRGRTADRDDHLDADDRQRAIEMCEHAIDALRTGDPVRAQALLAEAHATVERTQSTETDTQTQREVAWDCYD